MTTTRKGTGVGGYTVQFDAAPDRVYPWDVLNESGTLLDSFAVRYKAIDDAKARGAGGGETRTLDRLGDLRGEIADLLEEVEDEDLLRRIKAMITAQ